MKIHVLSDLHLEFAGFVPPKVDADVVVLDGDIAIGLKGLYWARKHFSHHPIFFVPGNHEYYGARLEGMAVEMRSCAKELGIHCLDNDVLEIDGVRFIGATLWTDFELFGSSLKQIGDALHAAKNYVSDFSQIIYGTTGWLRPEQTVTLHRIARQFIADSLAQPFDGPTVVVTHHLPALVCVAPQYQKDIVSAAFASRLEPLVEQADLWICGHTHVSIKTRIGNDPAKGQIICNPRGYPRRVEGGFENPDFDPSLVVEVGPRIKF